MTERAEQLRKQILALTAEYHAEAFPQREFVSGTSTVPVSGKVIGPEDVCSVVDSALDGWFTTGRFAKEFERKLARFVGVRSASLVNSGSSANLVALSALTSPKLGDRRLKPGDEVITVAAGFPRQALHAFVLGFQHPSLHKTLRFEAPWPADFAELVGALRGLNKP